MSQGNKSHVPQLLKLMSLSARALQQEKPLQGEAQAPELESSPYSCARSPREATKTQQSKKIH